MKEIQIIRVCELKQGDSIIAFGLHFQVARIKEGQFVLNYVFGSSRSSPIRLGIHSQQKVEKVVI